MLAHESRQLAPWLIYNVGQNMRRDMITYYRRRASEYERVYAKPERQEDLRQLRAMVGAAFQGQKVLELSCGTGYWTEVIAPAAQSVLACDISPEVLEIARGKEWGSSLVEFRKADSYALPDLGSRFSAGFAGFWWSHIPKRRLAGFLSQFHCALTAGAQVMFVDNLFVEGSSTPIHRMDDEGDTFQQRRLDDGSVYEVLKNFPSKDELLRSIEGIGISPNLISTQYFWVFTYKVA